MPMKKLILLFLPLVAAQWGCKKQTVTTPASGTYASARLGILSYNCETGAPGALVKNGKGALRHSVVGANIAQYAVTTYYTPATFLTPNITVQNNTTYISGFYKIIPNYTNSSLASYDAITFEIPFSDSYTIKTWYIEYGFSAPVGSGNLATCSNPTFNGNAICYRWYKKIDCYDGFVPSLNDGFSVLISDEDPNGFKGNCF